MTLTRLVGATASAAVFAGVITGLSLVNSISPTVHRAVRPAVFGVPLPLDPAAEVPTVEQLDGVLNGLADPGVPFRAKSYLIEGGVGMVESRTADALMRNAVAKGLMPLSFSIGDIAAVGPGAATATVTASGPGMAPTTQAVTFVDQSGWKLSRASAATVLSMFSA